MLKRVLIAMATLLVIMAAGVSPASAEPAAPRSPSAQANWYRIANLNWSSGDPLLCLAVAGGVARPGVQVIQWPCNRGAEQTWLINSNNEWSPIRFNSELCLAIAGASMVRGAAAILWPCNGGREQLWDVGSLYIDTIRNINSTQCLAISGGSKTPGAKAIQWPCNGGPEQRWRFYNLA